MNFEELYRTLMSLYAHAHAAAEAPEEEDAPVEPETRPAHGDDFFNTCTELYDILSPLFPGGPGAASHFTTETLNQVLDPLFRLREAAQREVDANADGQTGPVLGSKADVLMVDELIRHFASIDVTKGMTLKEACDTLDEQINRTRVDPGTAGANMSTRLKVSTRLANGKQVNGFFTKEKKLFNFDPYGEYESFVRQAREAHPDDREFTSFCDDILNHPMKAGVLLAVCDPEVKFNHYVRPANEPDALIVDRAYRTAELSHSIHSYARFPTNKNIREMLASFRLKVKDEEVVIASDQWETYGDLTTEDGLAADVGSSVPGRNVAMSRIASLLGMPELIARAVPMTVQTPKGLTRGVFMEEAKGYDFPDGNSIKGTHFAYVRPNAFESIGLRDMNDLGWIDRLCMNVDRHQNNLFYDFDEDGMLKTVQGIDNDMSFGKIKLKEYQTFRWCPALSALTVVSERMCNAVKRLTPAAVKAALDDTGLKEDEIRAVCDRLTELKEKVATAVPNPDTVGKYKQRHKLGVSGSNVRIVKDHQWSQMSPSLLKVTKDENMGTFDQMNIFNSASYAPYLVREQHEDGPEPAGLKEPLTYTESTELNVLSVEGLKESRKMIGKWVDKLNGTTRFHGNKERFEEMMTAAKDFMDLEPSGVGELDDAQLKQYQAAIANVREKVNAYMVYKRAEQNPSRTGRNRMEYAEALNEVLNGHSESLTLADKKRREKKLEECEAAVAREETKLDTILKTLTRQAQAGSEAARAKSFDELKNYFFRTTSIERLLNRTVTVDGKEVEAMDYYADLAKQAPDQLLEAFNKEQMKEFKLLFSLTNTYMAKGYAEPGITPDEVRQQIMRSEGYKALLAPSYNDADGSKFWRVDEHVRTARENPDALFETFKKVQLEAEAKARERAAASVIQPVAGGNRQPAAVGNRQPVAGGNAQPVADGNAQPAAGGNAQPVAGGNGNEPPQIGAVGMNDSH